MARAPDCIASHACLPGSNPAVPLWGFQRNIIVSPFSMLLGDYVNSGFVELKLSKFTVKVKVTVLCVLRPRKNEAMEKFFLL